MTARMSMVRIIPTSTEEPVFEGIKLPNLVYKGTTVKRRKTVRQQITEAVDNAAPGSDPVEVVSNLVKQKGWQ